MSFASIGIKTSIPVTAPAATSGAVTFSSIDPVNWLQITGKATVGSGSLYLLRWNADLTEWRPYMEDRPIAVNSSTLGGFFSASFPFPGRDESFVLYDPAAAITATASCARTSSPLASGLGSSGGGGGGGDATAANQVTGNASLASIDTKLTNPLPVSETGNAATPTRSFVNASASSVTLLAANSSRQSASFFNNSNVDLYLREDGGTADTTTGFTAILRANGGYYELPIGADRSITRGTITGIWTSAGSSGVAVCERV